MAEMKTYTGGCHCGKIRFEVTTDLAKVIECNCSHCSRKGFLLNFVPQPQFKLLAGTDAATEYLFNKKAIRHLFCSTCGVESYALGSTRDGQPMYAVNVGCLAGVDPASLKITQVDGRSF